MSYWKSTGKYGWFEECPKCGERMDPKGSEYGDKWWLCPKCGHRIDVPPLPGKTIGQIIRERDSK